MSKKDSSSLEKQRQRDIKQKEAYKTRVGPLVTFLRKHKLKFSNAQVGNVRVQYFRLDDLDRLLQTHKEQIAKDEQFSNLVKNRYKQFVFFKRPEEIKIKYPKLLEPVDPSNPDKKYGSFRFDTTESKTLRTVLTVLIALSLVLFPIWPFEVKYGIWLVSLILLIIIVGVIIIRLLIYIPGAIFDYHVWIFPNLFIEQGFWASFVPFIEYSRGDKSWFNLFIRLFAVSSFLLLVLHIYLNPTFFDQSIGFTRETIIDVHDWGVGKIKNQGNFSQRAITNLDKILNQTADVDQNSPEIPQQSDKSVPQEQNEQKRQIFVQDQIQDRPQQNIQL